MKRRLPAAAAVAVALVPGVVVPPAGAAPASGAPTFVGVRAVEYDLTLSRAGISPGKTIVQLVNNGEDPHDLNIRAKSGGPTKGIGVVPSGGTASTELNLRKGTRYVLYCDLLNHRALGMHATLRVRRH